jgi:hypothetical protein
MDGSSFSGLLTRVDIGHMRIRSGSLAAPLILRADRSQTLLCQNSSICRASLPSRKLVSSPIPFNISNDHLEFPEPISIPKSLSRFLAASTTCSSWPAPGSEDTELGVLMELEVGHGETEVYPRVQA